MTEGIFGRMANLSERLCGTEPMRAKPKGEWSFGEYIARILCNEKDIQHVSPIIFGLPGVGKSTTATSIAMSTAGNMARILGGNPVDYFNPKEDIWIADDQDEFVRTLGKSERHVFILDEAGLVEDSRDGMKAENKTRTKAAAVARDRRCCIIRCCQTQDMVDKRIRALSTHLVHIVEDHHSENYNVVQILKLWLAHVDKDPYKVYLSPNGIDRIVRHIIYAPQKEDYEQYISMRKEVVEDYLTKDRKAKPVSEKQQKTDAKCAAAWRYYLDESHPYVSINKAALAHGVDGKTLQRWMADPERGLDVKESPVVLASQRAEDSKAEPENVARET